MIDKKILIHNLYRQFEKDKWDIERLLLSSMNEVLLITKRNGLKINMVIKIEKDEK